MAWRSNAALLVLALAGTSLAGCIEAPGFLNSNSDEVSALDNKGLADEAALAWNAKAELVSIMAFEFSESDEPRIPIDGAVGNGLAPSWWYVYAAGSDFRGFRVDADGTVNVEDDGDMAAAHDTSMVKPLGEWSVDSDAAIQAAKTDETFREVAEGQNASVIEGIGNEEGLTAWWLVAMGEEGFVVASVDANSAELLFVTPLDFDMSDFGFSWGADPSSFGRSIHVETEGDLSEPFEYTFDTTSALEGVLQIELESSFPMQGAVWHIYNHEDEIIDDGYVGGWGMADEHEWELEIDEPGIYTLVLKQRNVIGPIGLPVGDAPEFALMLHLMSGHGHEHEDDEKHQH